MSIRSSLANRCRAAVVPVLGLMGLMGLVGCEVYAVAPTPTPNVIAGGRSDRPFIVDVSSLSDQPATCSHERGLKDFCVERFRQAFGEGLRAVLAGYMRPGPGGYKAEFKIVEFKHSAASGSVGGAGVIGMPAVQVSLRWQFVLRDPAGAPVIQLAETTVGPTRIFDAGAADSAIGALVNATLETIAKGLNDARFWTSPATPAQERVSESR